MTVQTDYFAFQGGLNLEQPPLQMPNGMLVDCSNYECLPAGGYRRIAGYETFDGQATPSMAVPGQGSVLGVHIYKGEVYAIREDGANARLYKSSASGWVEVDNAFTWSTGGTWRFANYNFYGQDSLETMYIVNGIDKAVQWDGTTLTQITTGAGTDSPKFVIGHAKHLVLAQESSLVISEIGNPLGYDPVGGAAEIAVGDTVKEFITSLGSLIVGCQDSAHVLYGTSSADWKLERLSGQGTIGRTMASIGRDIAVLDRGGIQSISGAQTYGNFIYGSMSTLINKILDTFGDESVAIYKSQENQYRMFTGRNGIYTTFANGQSVGVSMVSFNHDVVSLCNGYDEARNERTFFGSTNGYVYEMDKGYTFDGEPIYAYLVTAFNQYGNPSVNKRFRLIMPDMRVDGEPAAIGLRGTTDFGAGVLSRSQVAQALRTGGTLWDYGTWNNFSWDAVYHAQIQSRIALTGTNMAIMLSSAEQTAGTHTIYGCQVHYSQRRLKR